MNKTFKKVLSIVLSLAMVATSITVYNTTAKAADDLVRLESTADITGISDVNTEAFVSTADSAKLAIPHAFMGFLKAGVDHDGWGRIPANSPLRGQMVLALAVKQGGLQHWQ